MKFIIHAPPYMAGRAADIAAKLWRCGDLEKSDLVGMVFGKHAFSIKRNKASVSVWYHAKPPEAQLDPDKWDAF